jgi:CrcB protein
MLYTYIVVFLGAGMGGSLRHAVNRAALPFGWSFPWGTFGINVIGSLAMGLVAGWFAFRVGGGQHLGVITRDVSGQQLRLFLTTGLLGGFTTFSAFSLEAVLLWERGRAASAAAYVGGSVVLSLAALLIGVALMRP